MLQRPNKTSAFQVEFLARELCELNYLRIRLAEIELMNWT